MTRQFEPAPGSALSECPRCGMTNHCTLAAGCGNDCWCLTVKPAPGVLHGLAMEASGRCLCKACLSGEQGTDDEG